MQVHEDEEDVVVGRDEMRAGREGSQHSRAEVLGDPIAAAVELRPATHQEKERNHERQDPERAREAFEQDLAPDAREQRGHDVRGNVVAVPDEEIAPRAVHRHGRHVPHRH